MEKEKFDKLTQLADEIDDIFETLYKKGVFAKLEAKINKICSTLDEKYSLSFSFDLDIFDSEKENMIMLEKCGISCPGGQKPYRVHTSASTIHTYVVNGKVVKVPHDYCPNCWAEWDFKLMHTTCPECGMEMGKEIKLLLDTDICPNCEKGKVSRGKPKCDKCGYAVDTNVIHWG